MGDVVKFKPKEISADEAPTEDLVQPTDSGFRAHIPPERASVLTLRRWLEIDLEWVKRKRPKSYRTFLDAFQRLPDDFLALRFPSAHSRVDDGLLTSRMVLGVCDWLGAQVDELGRRRYSPSTVRSTHAYLRASLERARLEKLIESNPAHLPRGSLPPARPRPEFTARQQALSAGQASALLSVLLSLGRLRRLVGYAIELFTGVRISELVALTWGSLQKGGSGELSRLDVRVQYVRRDVQVDEDGTPKRRRKLILDATKNGDVRIIPVHPKLEQLLEAWRDRWPARDGIRRPPSSTDLILPGVYKGRLGPQSVDNYNDRLKEDLERIGVTSRTSHALRKSFIQIAVDAGADKQAIMSLTHREPTSVSTIYHFWSFERVSVEIRKIPITIELPTSQLSFWRDE